jgi:hypothetical protein
MDTQPFERGHSGRARLAGRRVSVLVSVGLACGILLSGGSTGMAVSGLAPAGQQVQNAQNRPVTGTAPDQRRAPGDGGVSTLGAGPAAGRGAGSSLRVGGGRDGARDLAQSRAVEGDGGELAFLGLSALAVALLGLGLLVLGEIMRRRTRSSA